jgi:ABC-2 type transport system permease protein
VKPSGRRIGAVLVKEVAELRRNRMALVPVILLAVFSIGLPFLIALVIPLIAGEPLAADPEFARIIKQGGIPPGTQHLDDEGLIQAFVFQQFLMMQLLIPVTGAMAFAGYSLIGEKQGRTLEPLLATPITTAELLVGKGLGALLPSLAIMLAASIVYFGGMSILAEPGVFRAVLNRRSVLLMLGVGPMAALVALQIAVLVSSRVNDPRTAQQFGALLILPLTALFVMQFNGVFTLTLPVILLLFAVLTAIWLVLVVVGVAAFDRETILTRWK